MSHLGVHGSMVAAAVAFPLLKGLLHLPGLCLVLYLRDCIHCLFERPFGQDLQAGDACEMLPGSTGIQRGPRQAGKTPGAVQAGSATRFSAV